MKTSSMIVILGIVIASSVIFTVSQSVSQDLNQSKRCDIPHDKNFIKSRSVLSSSDGTPRFSIEDEFSIFHTVPIDEFRVDDLAQSLILKPVPTSYGYVIMCDPLPVLEERLKTKLSSLGILVDGIEIPYEIENKVLRIDVNNNTRIEIVGFSKI